MVFNFLAGVLLFVMLKMVLDVKQCKKLSAPSSKFFQLVSWIGKKKKKEEAGNKSLTTWSKLGASVHVKDDDDDIHLRSVRFSPLLQ